MRTRKNAQTQRGDNTGYDRDAIETFRAEVKTWLEANFPKSLAFDFAAQLAKLQAQPESAQATAWRKALGEKGWGVPTWPRSWRWRAYPRAGRSAGRGNGKNRGPQSNWRDGCRVFGPTLLENGSDALKRQHLPGIVNGDVWWCQGTLNPALVPTSRRFGPLRKTKATTFS